ncbi:winged helix DNA-binding domain-containing protein [Haloechinothrix halophila]|uniref:winged helix DNA-binding domain-containing protein n=1 Tax=Haloechinothrix halophila TaxID=1069073 RepID=UPI0004269E21|nr:winged helix DNA-binding domain-containing protein [Haloechinothrix halophila]
MNTWPRDRVLRRRLATQRLTSAPLPRAGDAVRLLTCVQAQERDHAFFSLGLRSKDTTYSSVRTALDRGDVIRTHILRPTWHFVAPDDLRWILALTSRRVERSMAARHRQLGLDDTPQLHRALDLLPELLCDRAYLTRTEIGAEFAARTGLPEPGPQLGHTLLLAELRGLICSGPVKGTQHSYALVDEVVPATRERDRHEALVELVRRFFAGHGPASVKDFTRWSSLTVSDTRAALADIGDELEHIDVDGTTLWFDPSVPSRTTRTERAFLLPVYDEAVHTYPALNFPVADAHPHTDSDDPFWARMILDRRNVGLWKRTIRATSVRVETRLAPGLDAAQREAVRLGAQRMADFHERELDYAEGEGTPHLWGGSAGHPARRPRRAAGG